MHILSQRNGVALTTVPLSEISNLKSLLAEVKLDLLNEKKQLRNSEDEVKSLKLRAESQNHDFVRVLEDAERLKESVRVGKEKMREVKKKNVRRMEKM